MKITMFVPALLLLSVHLAAGEMQVVTYETFGAKGDGKMNDGPAIANAHAYANRHNLPVRAADDKTYYIGKMSPAIVQTDTDWGKAHFIIDDRDLFKNRAKPVFQVSPSKPVVKAESPAPLKRGSTSIGFAPGYPALVLVENGNVRQFIRKGLNQNGGSIRQEILLVDKDGKIDPATPVLWDYDTVTQMLLYPLENKTLTLKGGNFTTIANDAPSASTYYNRGIRVQRSHVNISGVRHTVTGEGEHGAPYNGFLIVSRTAFVTVENCSFSGHKTYRFPRRGKTVTMGTYDIDGDRACFVTWKNCTQLNDIHDTSKWGIFGSNFCRNLTLENCRFSRFDAHQGVANATLRNCEFGHAGISVTGYGTLLVENCKATANRMIWLRSDYGCFWRGKFIIRNSVLCGENAVLIIGNNNGTHDFGYPCMMPEEVVLENVRFENTEGREPACVFAAASPGKKVISPYRLTKKCTVKNVTAAYGGPVRIARKPEQFKNCIITKE